MKAKNNSAQYWTKNDCADGGHTNGRGFTIAWQRGPLVVEGRRFMPNGAFIEDVIDAVIDRLQYHQKTKFKCTANYVSL